MNKAILFMTFNRLDTTQKVFEQIAIAKPPRLYLASDGARSNKQKEKKAVEEIRNWLLENINWDCEVKTRFNEENMGCGKGVSSAITWFFEYEEDGIVLEDDTVPHQSFFKFCEEMLDRYKDDKRVWHIAGDNALGEVESEHSYFFFPLMLCWGWAGWRDRWTPHYEFSLKGYDKRNLYNLSDDPRIYEFFDNTLATMQSDKPIDTWDYQWALKILEKRGMCIVPSKNLITNIGFNGVHYENAHDDPRLNLPAHDIYEDGELHHPSEVFRDCYNSRLLCDVLFPWIHASIADNKEENVDFESTLMDKCENYSLSEVNCSRFYLKKIYYRALSHVTLGNKKRKFKEKYKKYKALYLNEINKNLIRATTNITNTIKHEREHITNTIKHEREHIISSIEQKNAHDLVRLQDFRTKYNDDAAKLVEAIVQEKKSTTEKLVHQFELISSIASKMNAPIVSYAQGGEDIILKAFYSNDDGKQTKFYIDLGAYHPENFSKTKILYDNGWCGINIDATPDSMDKFFLKRPKDINLEIAVSDSKGISDYYLFKDNSLNLFNKNLADKYIESGCVLENVVKVKTDTLTNILDKYLPAGQKIECIFMSIAGDEMRILNSFDFEKFSPTFFLISSMESECIDITETMYTDIYQFLKQHSYFPVAKTQQTVLYKKLAKKSK